jgi:hypothetical protein
LRRGLPFGIKVKTAAKFAIARAGLVVFAWLLQVTVGA